MRLRKACGQPAHSFLSWRMKTRPQSKLTDFIILGRACRSSAKHGRHADAAPSADADFQTCIEWFKAAGWSPSDFAEPSFVTVDARITALLGRATAHAVNATKAPQPDGRWDPIPIRLRELPWLAQRTRGMFHVCHDFPCECVLVTEAAVCYQSWAQLPTRSVYHS